MSLNCHCRPGGALCLLHFGQLSRKKREEIRRAMGLTRRHRAR